MSYSEDQFLAVLGRRRQFEKATQSLGLLTEQLAREELRFKGLEAELQREKADVEALEGLSLAALFYTILGDKDAQVQKERQGMLSAKLRYDACAHALQALKKEVRQREGQLRAFAAIEQDYEQALAGRAEFLKSAGAPEAAQLESMEEQTAGLHQEEQDLQEAVLAGEQALEALDDLKAALSSAENWGVWDMLGGGLLITHAKHSRINDAKQIAHHAQQYLRRLQTELEQLNASANLEVNTGTLLTFADYFIDGLVADWIVQSRIHHSMQQVEQTSTNVQQLLSVLRSRVRANADHRRTLLEERRHLLERFAH